MKLHKAIIQVKPLGSGKYFIDANPEAREPIEVILSYRSEDAHHVWFQYNDQFQWQDNQLGQLALLFSSNYEIIMLGPEIEKGA